MYKLFYDIGIQDVPGTKMPILDGITDYFDCKSGLYSSGWTNRASGSNIVFKGMTIQSDGSAGIYGNGQSYGYFSSPYSPNRTVYLVFKTEAFTSLAPAEILTSIKSQQAGDMFGIYVSGDLGDNRIGTDQWGVYVLSDITPYDYHVVVLTRNSDGANVLYIDGEEVAQGTNANEYGGIWGVGAIVMPDGTVLDRANTLQQIKMIGISNIVHSRDSIVENTNWLKAYYSKTVEEESQKVNYGYFFQDNTPADEYKLVTPQLKLADNSAGSLDFTMTSTNRLYEKIKRMKGLIKAYKHDRLIWEGRVLSEDTDFWGNKSLYCEGILSCLNDTHQPQYVYRDSTLRQYMEALLSVHNQKVDASKMFEIGIVTVNANLGTRVTNYESTWELFSSLVDEFGGHLFVRYDDNGKRYIDYRSECPRTSNQKIEFGVNLVDFTKSYDMSTLATVLLPLGKTIASDDGSEYDKYVTVEEVNGGSLYIKNDAAIQNYGWIEKQLTWRDVEDPNVLKNLAETYLNEGQFDEMTLKVDAVDLQLMGIDADRIDILDEVHVISTPHGLNKVFPVTEVTINLAEPSANTFTLGTKTSQTLTGVVADANDEVFARLNALPSQSATLASAKDNATQLINNATSGIFSFEYDDEGHTTGARLSNVSDWSADGAKGWRLTMGGIGYFGNGYNNPVTIALTGEDGGLVANSITTGTMNATHVRGGTLGLGHWRMADGSYMDGQLQLADNNGNIIVDMNKDGVYILGETNTKDSDNYYINIRNGKIYGGQGNDERFRIDATYDIDIYGSIHRGMYVSSDIVQFECNYFSINGNTGVNRGIDDRYDNFKYLSDIELQFTEINGVQVVTGITKYWIDEEFRNGILTST